jgi:hypothetical protein
LLERCIHFASHLGKPRIDIPEADARRAPTAFTTPKW